MTTSVLAFIDLNGIVGCERCEDLMNSRMVIESWHSSWGRKCDLSGDDVGKLVVIVVIVVTSCGHYFPF